MILWDLMGFNDLMGFKDCFRFVLMGFNDGLIGNHGIARDFSRLLN